VAPKWRDDRLFNYFTLLRRHLIKCDQCKGARKALIPENMCREGRQLTLSAADEFDIVIELRRKALSSHGGLIYACPDLAAHGKAYAIAAELFAVKGVQGELF